MELVELAGLRVAFERVGTGPTAVVLLHGYVGDGPATWRDQLDALADGYAVVAWDAPGAGGSADPRESLGMSGYADCLAAFIAALGLDRPASRGTVVRGRAGHRRRLPSPGNRAVAGGGLRVRRMGWLASSRRGRTAPRPSADPVELTPSEFVDTLLPTMFSTVPNPATVERFAASMRAFHPLGFRAMARASAEDLRDDLPRIDVPTLLVCGDQDVRAPLPVAEHLHAAVAGSTLIVLPGVGHVCNLEAPESFNNTVRTWLTDRS
jgi:pimeloyl-ACP methyl ester carboxylesterase